MSRSHLAARDALKNIVCEAIALAKMGAPCCQNGGVAHRSAGSRAVLAEPSEIEAPEGEDSIRLPNGFWSRYIRYGDLAAGGIVAM